MHPSFRPAFLALLLFVPSGDASASAPTPKRPPPGVLAATIRGRVTEKATSTPVVAASVTIVGTTRGGLSNNNGEYTIGGVPAGTVRVRAARIGFQPMEQTVTVPESGEVTVNFTLDHAVARLEEVVTTATGAQARRELGNVVASVRLDSIASLVPATTVQQLLTARASGLQIIQG